MYREITGEFESVEYAEFAAKHIRESAELAKISIIHNRKKLKGVLPNHEHDNATHGSIFYMLPTAISSYNYITGSETREVNKDLISEPLLSRTVTLVVRTDVGYADITAGIMASYGGYNIKNTSR